MTEDRDRTRAALDSSVLVPFWSRRALQRLAAPPEPWYTPDWSEWIVAETWRVLTFLWLTGGRDGLAAPDDTRLRQAATTMMRHLLPVMELVTVRDYAGPPPWPELSDQDDAPIWQTAIVGRARYVVSHNTRHFPPVADGRHEYGGVEYLTAIEFIEELLGDEAAIQLTGTIHAAALIRSGRTRRR